MTGLNSEKRLPKPDKPTPHECCGSGCVPCVYDYYYDALEKWEAQQKQLGLTREQQSDIGRVSTN